MMKFLSKEIGDELMISNPTPAPIPATPNMIAHHYRVSELGSRSSPPDNPIYPHPNDNIISKTNPPNPERYLELEDFINPGVGDSPSQHYYQNVLNRCEKALKRQATDDICEIIYKYRPENKSTDSFLMLDHDPFLLLDSIRLIEMKLREMT